MTQREVKAIETKVYTIHSLPGMRGFPLRIRPQQGSARFGQEAERGDWVSRRGRAGTAA